MNKPNKSLKEREEKNRDGGAIEQTNQKKMERWVEGEERRENKNLEGKRWAWGGLTKVEKITNMEGV